VDGRVRQTIGGQRHAPAGQVIDGRLARDLPKACREAGAGQAPGSRKIVQRPPAGDIAVQRGERGEPAMTGRSLREMCAQCLDQQRLGQMPGKQRAAGPWHAEFAHQAPDRAQQRSPARLRTNMHHRRQCSEQGACLHALQLEPAADTAAVAAAIGDVITSYVDYPAILGTDVAGEVVAVGAGVTRFRVGDRVLGHAAGLEKSRNRAAEGGFQEHVLLLAHMVSPIPETITFAQAAVLPLGLSTAACGLFQEDFLALQPPRFDPVPNGEVLLVWRGSTSVGSNAIQLAQAAGYEVVTTCSARNFAYVRGLGAAHAFDYRSPTAKRDILAALRGRKCGLDRQGLGGGVHGRSGGERGQPLPCASHPAHLVRRRSGGARAAAQARPGHRQDGVRQHRTGAAGAAPGRAHEDGLGRLAHQQPGRAADL